MKVDLLDRAMVDSDLGVVNAARCSFDKMSSWEDTTGTSQESALILSQRDSKLIQYLAQHQHWTPFAHAQEVFSIDIDKGDLLLFMTTANLSGFEWVLPYDVFTSSDKCSIIMRGSLYAWITQACNFPVHIADPIMWCIFNKYPVSFNALSCKYINLNITTIIGPVVPLNFDELTSVTLRLHVPIFVKRQLETHRRNFVMTDIEDFSQNEVSRRYVDSEPEFYTPTWRLQSKDKKQGSSDEEMLDSTRYLTESHYSQHMHTCQMYYDRCNQNGIAHEQSRLFLPLSTYTTFWWTGSLKSWKRMLSLRLDSHVQSETREVAQMCHDALVSTGVHL